MSSIDLICFFETGSDYVALGDLELVILLLQPEIIGVCHHPQIKVRVKSRKLGQKVLGGGSTPIYILRQRSRMVRRLGLAHSLAGLRLRSPYKDSAVSWLSCCPSPRHSLPDKWVPSYTHVVPGLGLPLRCLYGDMDRC